MLNSTLINAHIEINFRYFFNLTNILSDPFVKFAIQSVIIIVLCRLLAFLLAKVQQPPVIGEIIAGILLGPSAMGRIPGFTDTLFPEDSVDIMRLVATLGLVMLLFLIGLETDPRQVVKSGFKVVVITLAGFSVPFALGAGVSRIYWINLTDQSVPYTTFFVFVSTAIAVTSLSVLARVVANLKLVGTSLGTIAIACGVLNDTIGYILLALGISIVPGAGSLVLSPLYTLLMAFGWIFVLVLIIRPALLMWIRLEDDIEIGPNTTTMMFILLIAFGSAFVTDIIGVHPIFGAFLAGIMIPHERGFAIRVTEKCEELVSLLFIPLYFALSGFKTQLALLNSAMIWGLLVLGLLAIVVGKLVGTVVASLAMGLEWREAVACGALANSKAIIELIILNVALDMKVINPTVFVMFVVCFICCTLITTPLTLYAYPTWYRKQREHNQARKIGGPVNGEEGRESQTIMFAINNVHHLPALMVLAGLTKLKHGVLTDKLTRFHALRYIEFTGRVSSIMQMLEAKDSLKGDPILDTVWTFGQLNRLDITTHISLSLPAEMPETIAQHASDVNAKLVIIPWDGHRVHSHQTVGDGMDSFVNYDEDLFHSYTTSDDMGHVNPHYAHFLNRLLKHIDCSVGVLVDRGLSMPFKSDIAQDSNISTNEESPDTYVSTNHGMRLFIPFFGGADDRAAVRMAVEFCAGHPNITATVLQIIKSETPSVANVNSIMLVSPPTHWNNVHHSQLHSAMATPAASPHSTIQHPGPSRALTQQLDLVHLFKSSQADPPDTGGVQNEKTVFPGFTAPPTPSKLTSLAHRQHSATTGKSDHDHAQTVHPNTSEQLESSMADKLLLTRLFGTKMRTQPEKSSLIGSMVAAARRGSTVPNTQETATADTMSTLGGPINQDSNASKTDGSGDQLPPSNIELITITTSTPLATAIAEAKNRLATNDLLVLGRNKRGVTEVWRHREEISELVARAHDQPWDERFRRERYFDRYERIGGVLGSVAQGMLLGDVKGSVLVVQAPVGKVVT